MIVSKYGKSYDTADGSEQQFDDPTSRARGGGRAAAQRWQDDGAPHNERPPVAHAAGEFTSRPAWSVLSLRDLNEAVRQESRGNAPARLRQESERAERRGRCAAQAADDRAAAAARAGSDRHRNAWENT